MRWGFVKRFQTTQKSTHSTLLSAVKFYEFQHCTAIIKFKKFSETIYFEAD